MTSRSSPALVRPRSFLPVFYLCLKITDSLYLCSIMHCSLKKSLKNSIYTLFSEKSCFALIILFMINVQYNKINDLMLKHESGIKKKNCIKSTLHDGLRIESGSSNATVQKPPEKMHQPRNSHNKEILMQTCKVMRFPRRISPGFYLEKFPKTLLGDVKKKPFHDSSRVRCVCVCMRIT